MCIKIFFIILFAYLFGELASKCSNPNLWKRTFPNTNIAELRSFDFRYNSLENPFFNLKICFHFWSDGESKEDKLKYPYCEAYFFTDNSEHVETKELSAKVDEDIEFPRCLKKFRDVVRLPFCGHPNFSLFRYCSKAYFFKNMDVDEFEENVSEHKQIDELLVLINGCLNCYDWEERIPNYDRNVEVRLFSGNATKNACPLKSYLLSESHSVSYGDFMIGAVFGDPFEDALLSKYPEKDRYRCSTDPSGARSDGVYRDAYLEIKHRCNRDTNTQTKIVRLPELDVRSLANQVWEMTEVEITLNQEEQFHYVDFDTLPGKADATAYPKKYLRTLVEDHLQDNETTLDESLIYQFTIDQSSTVTDLNTTEKSITDQTMTTSRELSTDPSSNQSTPTQPTIQLDQLNHNDTMGNTSTTD